VSIEIEERQKKMYCTIQIPVLAKLAHGCLESKDKMHSYSEDRNKQINSLNQYALVGKACTQ